MRTTLPYLIASAALALSAGITYGYGGGWGLPPLAVAALTALLIVPSAALFVWYCLPKYAGHSRAFFALFVALFIITPVATYSLKGPESSAVFLASSVFLSYALIGWVYTASLPTAAAPSLKNLIVGLAGAVGKVVAAALIVLGVTLATSYALMLANNSPLLAGDEVVLPSPLPQSVPAKDAVLGINVSASNLGASVRVIGEYIVRGVFHGNITEPLNAVIDTPVGELHLTRELIGRVSVVEEPIEVSNQALTPFIKPLVNILASIWATYAPLLDPRALTIMVGIVLLGIGTKLTMG